jgi:effector-binding domain-containing protein
MKSFLKPGYFLTIPIIFCANGFLIRSINNTGTHNIHKIQAQEPTITLEQKATPKRTVIYVTDSAASTAEITQKFMKIIPFELGVYLKKNSLQMMGPPMAWYSGNKAPYIFDIGAPVNKAAAADGRVKIREMDAGNAVVAHFFGPYELSWKAYPLAEAWIKEHNKTADGAPYEVYIGDPGVEKDPYKILTDIVFPVK